MENKQDTEPKIEDIFVVMNYLDVFQPLEGLPPPRSNPFTINLEPVEVPIVKAPYRMAPAELSELKKQLGDLMDKSFIRPCSSPWESIISKKERWKHVFVY